MATYVIGDLQGCFEPLQRLLAAVNYQPGADTLWFCGDLIARGPDSLACLDFVRQLPDSTAVVLGNHDLHFIACYYGISRVKPADNLSTLLAAAHLPDLVAWLREKPLLHLGPDQAYLMAHAGIAPEWDITTAITCAAEVSQQLRQQPKKLLTAMYGNTPKRWRDVKTPEERWRFTINAFTRMRYCYRDGGLELSTKSAESANDQLTPWYELWRNRTHPEIFFGHWAALNGHSPVPGIHALDTGCVWGNMLTAYCVETKQRYSVKA